MKRKKAGEEAATVATLAPDEDEDDGEDVLLPAGEGRL